MGKLAFDLFDYEASFLSDEHKMFRDSLRKFLEKEAVPYKQEWEENGLTPREFYKKMGEQGFLCPQVAEEYGGLGLDFGFNIVLNNELSYAEAGGGATLHTSVAVPYIENYGSEELKKKYLPGCVNGDIFTAIAMTEPGTGSDLSSMQTTAVRDGDHYIINGEKTFITNGINAELIIVAVKTDPHAEPAHRGVSLVLVEEGTPGFKRGRNLKKLGSRASDTAELIFEDCRVPVENLLGEEGKGFYYLMSKLQQERIISAGGALVLAEVTLRDTIEYVKSRKAFGQPVSKFQNTQFEIAEMATEIAMSRSFLNDIIERHMRGEDVVTEVSMAKYFITDMARRNATRCLQLYGGYGYMEEYPIARRYRDVAVMPIYAGSNEIMKNIIARNMGL